MTIELCGQLSVSVDGRRREADLPGRQGRLALAHLALNRKGGVTRERLIAALWGEDAPAGHGQALNVVLSKLRRALGPEVIENAGERAVQLTPAATVDLDEAQPALDEAFAARDRGDWAAVVEAAGRVAELADAGLLPGYEAPWLEDPRRRLEELGLQARELRGDAGLAMGGAELAPAERAAQELVELAPYRESGYLLLMRVREAQGNLVEALRVHERLRTLLRDELGVAPGPQVQAEFERMLKAERAEPEPAPVPPPAAPEPDGGQPFFATRSGAAFVGRRGELDRLRQYLQRATEGNRQLVLLEGEPGIGKTRLAMEFMEVCEAEGSLALYGRCDAETLVPYQPFVEALRRYVARAPEQAGAWRAQHGAELGRVIPELAGAGDTPGGPEEEERYRLFDAVSEVLNDIARHQPVVLVLDDLHWADKPTLLMLRQMVRAAGESPLLIVATIRDTERPAALVDMLVQLRREHYFDRIELTGLGEEDATALIGEFGPQGIPDHVNRALWEETKGNPFFLEEMVRHLGSTTPKSEGNGAWPLELPEGIREVIGRRLATLSERAGQLLTTAAVMGREFRVEVLETVSDLDEDAVDEVIEESVGAHVIAEVPGVYGRCSFTHALIRQTLYDGLTATRRARLHLRVAEALEELEADSPEPPLAELAYHFSLAPPARGGAEGGRVRRASRPARGRRARLRGGGAALRGRARGARAGARRPRAHAAGCCSPAGTPRPRRATRWRHTPRSAARPTRRARSARRSCSPSPHSAMACRARWQAGSSTTSSSPCSRRRSTPSVTTTRPCAPGSSRGWRSSSASPRRASAAPSSAARPSNSPARSATLAASGSRWWRATGRCGAPATCRSASRRPTTCSASRRAPARSRLRSPATAGA